MGSFEDCWGWVKRRWVWVGSGNFTHSQPTQSQVLSLPFCALLRPLWPCLGPFVAFIGSFEDGWGWVELGIVWVGSWTFTHPQPTHSQVLNLPFCALLRPLWPFLGPFVTYIGSFEDWWGWVELWWEWVVSGNFTHPNPVIFKFLICPFVLF